jgi:hypothetical protein
MKPVVHPQTESQLLGKDQKEKKGYYFGVPPQHAGAKLRKNETRLQKRRKAYAEPCMRV